MSDDSAARLTRRLPIAATDECRFARWMQPEREMDIMSISRLGCIIMMKERSFESSQPS